MKYILFSVVISVMLFACSAKETTVYQYLNKLTSNDTNLLINDSLYASLKISSNRNLVFFLNASCSLCISDFVSFAKNINDYRFDSLIVIASEVYDFIQTDYYLQRENITLPKNSRIIIDPKNKLFVEMANIYGDKNIFLIEDKRILYKNNTGYFKYDKTYGYVLEQTHLKK